jgi:chromatin segregation and condensation protein Rec8/ScpA/Scc1 (kleisin family)
VLRRRAAIASTLVTGLELARAGEVMLDQEVPFGRLTAASLANGLVAPCKPPSDPYLA